MQKLKSFMLVAALTFGCASSTAPLHAEQKQKLSSLVSIAEFDKQHFYQDIQKGMKLWNIPGMAVSVVSGTEILFQKGFGKTTVTNGIDINNHTLFPIASTTKAMVAAGIMILVDEGKIHLDDLVIKYIPELHFATPSLTQQITIRDLLAHRTGLPGTDLWFFLEELSLEKQIPLLRTVVPEADIRTRFIYQNTMYELVGLVIERVSGKKWEAFLSERLWHPIGMEETYATRGEIPKAMSHVLPHENIDGQLTQAIWDMSINHRNAAGSVWSSINDMSLWAQFLLNGAKTSAGKRLISPGSFAQMFEPNQLSAPEDFNPTVELTKPNWRSYSLGWFQQDFLGRKIEYHTGALTGSVALIGLDLRQKKAVIVLTNRGHSQFRHALFWSVMDNRTGTERPDWGQEVFDLYQRGILKSENEAEELRKLRIPNTKTSLGLTEYVGTYENKTVGKILIKKIGNDLYLITNKITFALPHWHLDTFQVINKEREYSDFISFEIGVRGRIETVKVFGFDFIPQQIDTDSTTVATGCEACE